jgi:hypothetical protein
MDMNCVGTVVVLKVFYNPIELFGFIRTLCQQLASRPTDVMLNDRLDNVRSQEITELFSERMHFRKKGHSGTELTTVVGEFIGVDLNGAEGTCPPIT